MIDAQLSGLAKELREKGIDCQTVHMVMRGNEDSSVSISDAEILRFLTLSKGEITLITLDNELATYCTTFGVPCLRVQDAVADAIAKAATGKN